MSSRIGSGNTDRAKGTDAEVIPMLPGRGIAGTVQNMYRTVTDVERYHVLQEMSMCKIVMHPIAILFLFYLGGLL